LPINPFAAFVFNFVYAQLEHIFEISSVRRAVLPHIGHYSAGSLGCCPVIVLAAREIFPTGTTTTTTALACRCRFPMSTFIYANLISILNALLCVSV